MYGTLSFQLSDVFYHVFAQILAILFRISDLSLSRLVISTLAPPELKFFIYFPKNFAQKFTFLPILPLNNLAYECENGQKTCLTQTQQTAIHEDFIAQCMDILRSSYDTVSMLTQNDSQLAELTQKLCRTLRVLYEYISECDNDYLEERTLLPLYRAAREVVCPRFFQNTYGCSTLLRKKCVCSKLLQGSEI